MNQLEKSETLISSINKNSKFFKVVEDSNYKITDSYNNEYVVTFQQFKEILNSIFLSENQFVTINNTIINKKYVYKIEPTSCLTEEEEAKRTKKQRIDFHGGYIN